MCYISLLSSGKEPPTVPAKESTSIPSYTWPLTVIDVGLYFSFTIYLIMCFCYLEDLVGNFGCCNYGTALSTTKGILFLGLKRSTINYI